MRKKFSIIAVGLLVTGAVVGVLYHSLSVQPSSPDGLRGANHQNPVHDARVKPTALNTKVADWPMYNRTLTSQRYRSRSPQKMWDTCESCALMTLISLLPFSPGYQYRRE
jgi:hypothetical protein